MIYIGAEEIISPLGDTAAENFSAMLAGRSGISLVPGAGFNGFPLNLSKIPALTGPRKFEKLLVSTVVSLVRNVDEGILASDRTLLLLSSTKGSLEDGIDDQFGETVKALMTRFKLVNQPVVISNACISGVLAINAGGNLIKNGFYDHIIVIGCDLISDFVLYGFQSLFAISDQPCAPFDAARNGITMGEGAGGVVLSNTSSIFRERPFKILIGASANDANHISGPSRTGEGLYRSVTKTLESNNISAADIGFISAHGTGTIYNDEMESVAFDRLGLTNVPLNSLKGYFGHTLGAAGVIESAVSMQMMREQMLIKSQGFNDVGTTKQLNIIQENNRSALHTVLKTASGFGGGNASLIIQQI
jgi:3-oxoacyl-[acyl-carrier-protein] synthase-1